MTARRLAAAVAAALAALIVEAALAADPPAKTAPTIAAKVAIAKGFDAIDDDRKCAEGRNETIFLTVENGATVDLRVTRVTLHAPTDLRLCDGAPAQGAGATRVERNDLVPAGRRAVVPLAVGAGGRLRSGTFPLLLEVNLTADLDGAKRTDSVVVTDKVQLQIPGLSDALKLLGVPTLLLLPGFLVLAALGAFYAPWKWADATKPSNTTFWIFAIPISFALSAFYAFFAPYFSEEANLAQRYNLVDVAIVWLISIVIGGLFGLWRKSEDAKAAKRDADQDRGTRAAGTIAAGDDPRVLLGKTAHLKAPWPLQWNTTGSRQGFLVGPDSASARWLVPQAKVAATRPAALAAEEWRKLRAEFEAFLGKSPSREALIEGLSGPFKALPLVWHGTEGAYALGAQESPAPASPHDFFYLP